MVYAAGMGLQRSGTDRGADVVPGGAPPKLKFKRSAEGELKIDEPPADATHEAVEAAERPPVPGDPRDSRERNVPFPG